MANKEKQILMNILNEYIDDIFLDKNFKRKRNTKIYQWKSSEAVQTVDFDYQIRPYYQKTAIIRIYPNIRILFEKLQNEVDNVFRDYDYVPFLGRDIHDNYTICQRVEFHGNQDRWYVFDENNYADVSKKIIKYLSEYTIPFLEKCNSIEGLINTYENTNYIAMDNRIRINLIVAYFLQNDNDKAKALLENSRNNEYFQDIYHTLYSAYCK